MADLGVGGLLNQFKKKLAISQWMIFFFIFGSKLQGGGGGVNKKFGPNPYFHFFLKDELPY